VGFSLFGEYGEQNPPRKLIDAVETGAVDVAIVWGPFAGYFSQGARLPLDIAPVTPSTFGGVPFTYEISAAVREGNNTLKTELDQILQSQSAAVHRILEQYAVPQVP
jgi:mxaJ protein